MSRAGQLVGCRHGLERHLLGNALRRCGSSRVTTLRARHAKADAAGQLQQRVQDEVLQAGASNPREVAEVALLSACGALAYMLAAAFRLEATLGAFFPMPLVVAAARWPSGVVWQTLRGTTLLLLLLGGPLRASSFLLLHGSLGASLGLAWAAKWPWAASVPAAALCRTLGVVGSLAISSLLLRENIAGLVVAQISAALDQMASLVGAVSPLSLPMVYALTFALVLANALMYSLIMHLLLAVLSTALFTEREFGNVPEVIKRALFPPQ